MTSYHINMGMVRADASMFARADTTEALPLRKNFFPPVQLTPAMEHEYTLVVKLLLEDALERARKDRIYGGADESWRDVGDSRGFKRYTKTEGRMHFYRVQGVVRSPLASLMTLLYADSDRQVVKRRKFLYDDGLDAQTLHVLRSRTNENPFEQMTMRWQAIEISCSTGSLKRDMCVLEYTGLTTDSDGLTVGFKIGHTIDLKECRSLEVSHGITRMQGTEVFLFRPTRNSNHTEMSIVGSSDLEAASVPVYLMNTFLSHVVSCCSKLPMAIQERRLSSLSILDKHLCVPLSDRKNCFVCLSKFGMLSKKLHCRSCGEVACKSCIVSQANVDDGKFCKKCIIMASTKDELLLEHYNKQEDIHLPLNHSHYASSASSSSPRSRASNVSSLASSVYSMHSSSSVSHTSSGAKKKLYVDMKPLDDLKPPRDGNSMTSSEGSYGYASTTPYLSREYQSEISEYVPESERVVYIDTKEMQRSHEYASGNRYRPQVVVSPLQDVEDSIAHQRYLLKEMLSQSQSYGKKPQTQVRASPYYAASPSGADIQRGKMPTVSLSIKWGKQVFSDVPVDTNAPVAVLKAQLYALTFVPVERQKIMSKAWKGMLKDDVDLSTLDKLVNGTGVMLMGSAEVVEKPKEATVFIEDMTAKDVAAAGVVYPAGLTNLGNTCYMNATLQCLRPVAEFREALRKQTGGQSSDIANNFTTALRDLYAQLDASVDNMTPALFVTVLRRAFPQFAQQSPRGGGFMQQDSEEFLSTLMSTLSRTLTTPVGLPSLGPTSNMIEALFGLEMTEKLECSETELEPAIVKTEKALKLVCNITIETNHLADGIKIGLEGGIEKHSDVLGRNATWKKTLRINRLPKYLCVQFMRFYWKLTPESRDHTGVKCKMLRPISFPQVLDVYDHCSDELKATMKIARDKNAEKILNEFKESQSGEQETKESEDTEMLSEEEKAALEEAKSLSLGGKSPGLGLPVDFQGNYELYAILTHKGRSADSGHYMAWVRHEGDDWFCYDDEDVSPCKTEDIQKLKGGGDWHMTYLAFYRAKN